MIVLGVCRSRFGPIARPLEWFVGQPARILAPQNSAVGYQKEGSNNDVALFAMDSWLQWHHEARVIGVGHQEI